MDTVEEAKKSIHDLKLSKQHKVIELWRTVEERNSSTADPPALHATDDEELDSSALIIEVKDSAACVAEELDTHPELHLLNERKIAQLHRYNEIKDFAHVLLGALAEEQLTTVKELYRMFNMEV